VLPVFCSCHSIECASDTSCHGDWLCYSSRDSGISSSKSSRRTPAATPAYKYNDWMDNKKSVKYTPKLVATGRENAKGFVFIYCLYVTSEVIRSAILDFVKFTRL